MAPLKSLIVIVLLTRSGAFQVGVTASMIPRCASGIEAQEVQDCDPKDIDMSLREDFFDDIESCSTKPANLDEVLFLFFIMS